MKKLLAGLLSACLVLGTMGCGKSPAATSETPTTAPQQETVSVDPTVAVQDSTTDLAVHAIAMPTVKEEVFSDDGTLVFSFSFPQFQMHLSDEALEEQLTGALQTHLGSILSAAEELGSSAQEDYLLVEGDWTPYFFDISYTPTRLDQSVMSLFGNRLVYTGGAHPNGVTDSITYDLQTGDQLHLEDILVEDYSKDTLYNLVLRALEGKATELSYDYQEVLTQLFYDEENTVEDWYFSRSGLCFHFSPYAIAPYSSGTIIAELPYEDLTDLLRSQYLPTVSENATGSMYAEVAAKDAEDRFGFIADVELGDPSSPILLYCDALVTDLRIEIGTQSEPGSSFISTGVVFMADHLDIGNAIRIHSDETQLLRLVYRSGDHEVSSLITWDEASGSVVLTSK